MTTYMDSRAPSAAGTPTVLRTFVLGDMVASTRLWEQHGDRMPEVLARLDASVESHLLVWDGHRPAEQGEGDNFVVAFARPEDAVGFAAALQGDLCAQTWPDDLEVSLRMAVHTGPVGRRDAERYMGETLNRCARLRALGHGGQVLVSAVSAGAVVEELSAGVFLRDLGTHYLRDLALPERVAQLCGPGLPFDFPGLLSLNRALTNLPGQVTTFVGRATELAETGALLGERRLVTLAGAGGCGKTRLGVQLGAELLDAFPDGVWFADLAPLTDPDLVARALATAAGVSEMTGQPILDTLADRFSSATALLVLDNCEHLLDGAVTVADAMLRRCPGVRVLATSREPLGADGEATYRVPSLNLPAGADDAGCESVALFLDRAGLARPNLRWGPEEVAAATVICTRLDGIPLAIELAAARCRAMTPSQIAERLTRHFDLLTGGSRRALPRHRALEASIEWSYDLLEEEERALLRRLAVFSGGFTLEAAEAVGAAEVDETWGVVDRLAGLTDKSLVLHNDAGRYRLLETVRQFAESRLVAAGEATASRDRHVAYYSALAMAAEQDLYGSAILVCRDRLELELDNICAATDWAIANDQGDLTLQMIVPLNLFWQIHLAEGIERLKRALAVPGTDRELRMRALSMAAELECQHGDLAWMLTASQECLDLVDEHTDPGVHGYMLGYNAWARWCLGEESVSQDLDRAIALTRQGKGARHQFSLLDVLAIPSLVVTCCGDTASAVVAAREIYEASPQTHNPLTIGRGAIWFGFIQAVRGEFAEARPALTTSVNLLEQCGDDLGLFSAGALGLVDCLSAAGPQAWTRLVADVAAARRGQQLFALSVSSWAAAVVRTRGYGSGPWAPLVDEAEDTMALVGLVWGQAWARAMRAENLLRQGDLPGARAAITAAADTATGSVRAGLARGPVELVAARLARAEGDPAAAEESVHRALAALVPAGLHLHQVEALELLGGLVTEQGSPAEGLRLFAAAAAARGALGYPVAPADVEQVTADIAAGRSALAAVAADEAWAAGLALALADALAGSTRGRGPRRRPATGWAALTPTEVEVAGLVAQGLSNPAIAAKLFVSPETVKTHVSNAFGKLGVANRTELASLVARRG